MHTIVRKTMTVASLIFFTMRLTSSCGIVFP
jgi:hypothetical protein